LEIRRIWTSTELNDYLDFPYAAQVFCIQRDTTEIVTGKVRTETVHGITSLSQKQVGPAGLLSHNRKHWSIENCLHWIRDVIFDEDRCRIRRWAGAQAMASLRNLAISLLRMAGATHIASALRSCSHDRSRPLRLIGLAIS
jgi:predicted transposase YbfD/YdcC